MSPVEPIPHRRSFAMAPTIPQDLKRSTWKKIKPLLMKKTGLGESLEKYAKARSDADKVKRYSLYMAAGKALDEVKKAVKTATDVATAGKHKDTIESLKAYPALVQKEAAAVAVESIKYLEKIKPNELPQNFNYTWWDAHRPPVKLDEDPKLKLKMDYFWDHYQQYRGLDLNSVKTDDIGKRVNCLRQMSPGINQSEAAIKKMIASCLTGDHNNTKAALQHYLVLLNGYKATRKQWVAHEKNTAKTVPALKQKMDEILTGDPDY
jgi:hypothetical protein